MRQSIRLGHSWLFSLKIFVENSPVRIEHIIIKLFSQKAISCSIRRFFVNSVCVYMDVQGNLSGITFQTDISHAHTHTFHGSLSL
jgi:hypothetical protein